jgi:hypothetical protein
MKWPSEEKVAEFAEIVERREPRMSKVIGFMDGFSLATECDSDPEVQSSFGYHSDTAVDSILVFGPDGKVFQCAINFPVS